MFDRAEAAMYERIAMCHREIERMTNELNFAELGLISVKNERKTWEDKNAQS